MEHDGFAREHVRFERNPNFIFRQIVDQAVLIPIHEPVALMDCIYTLSEVGAFVWRKLDRPTTRAELQQAILDVYDADPEAAAEDLACFLLQMVNIDAVRCVAPIRGTAPVQKG